MNWIDIAVIIILALSVVQGWRRGFIMTVVSFFKWFVGFTVAKLFYKTATAYCIANLWNPLPTMTEKIQGFLYDALSLDPTMSVAMSSLDMKTALSAMTLPSIYMENLEKLIPSTETLSNVFVQILAEKLSAVLFDALGFLVILLVAVGLFTLVGSMINTLSKLPVLNELNRGGGLLVGGFLGLATVYFIMAMLNYLYPLPFVGTVISAVETSQLGIYFYKYNVLTYLLKSFFEASGLIVFS